MRLFVAWLLALCGAAVIQGQKNINDEYYTGAVVEYNPSDGRVNPKRYIDTNLQAYLDFIDAAGRESVDILVFPEATLNYLDTREAMVEYGFILPDPNDRIAPWQHEGYSDVLKSISRKCKDKQIYVLVNLVEKVPCDDLNSSCRRPRKTYHDGFNIYNTNVVFDRQGRIISKYQKYNLFIEPLVDEPLTPQRATFTTDFGVKFGHFICFDIVFKEPAMALITKENVTNILFPSMWFSEMPFYTSTQLHQGWAYANNVNLLSAGASKPSQGSTGSGIFIGNKEIADIIISGKPKSKILIANVPKDVRAFESNNNPGKREISTAQEMQNLLISEYYADLNMPNVDIHKDSINICVENNICCTFNIKMKENPIPSGKVAYKYKLTANYSTRMFGPHRKCGEFHCAIIACTSDNPKSCGRRFTDNRQLVNAVEFESIEIIADVKYDIEEDIVGVPSTLDTSILPLEISSYEFTTLGTSSKIGSEFSKSYKIEAKEKVKDLLTFGINGRNFALDKEVTVGFSKNLL